MVPASVLGLVACPGSQHDVVYSGLTVPYVAARGLSVVERMNVKKPWVSLQTPLSL
jgi:hypothetical protein